jgi:hypothetical protein
MGGAEVVDGSDEESESPMPDLEPPADMFVDEGDGEDGEDDEDCGDGGATPSMVDSDADDAPLASLGASPKPKAKGKGKAKAKTSPKAKAKAKSNAKAKACSIVGSPKGSPKAKGKGKAVAKGSPKAQGKAKGKAKGSPKAKGKAKGKALVIAVPGAPGSSTDLAVLPQPPPPKPQGTPSTDLALADDNKWERVLCDSCRTWTSVHRCRLISKGKNAWRCVTCGTTQVQMRRKFGSWPTKSFELLSEDCCSHSYFGVAFITGCNLCD